MEKSYWKARADSPEYAIAKQRIIDAAIALIAEKSVSKLRFDSIAKQVGCARTTLYRYFDSKEQLLSDVITTLTYKIAAEVAQYSLESKDLPSQTIFASGVYQSIVRLQTSSEYAVLLEADNIHSFTEIAVEKMPEKIAPILERFIKEELNSEIQFREDLSMMEILSWLILQIICYAQFGLPGKDETSQQEFVNKMIVQVMLA